MQAPKPVEDAQEEKIKKDLGKSGSDKNNGAQPVAGTESANPVGNPNDVGQAGDYSR